MLKFSAANAGTGRPVVGIGLSRAECDRLLEGQPIHFATDDMDNLPVIEVYLIAGETEESMTLDMVRDGRVDLQSIRDEREPEIPELVRPADKGRAN